MSTQNICSHAVIRKILTIFGLKKKIALSGVINSVPKLL